MLLKFSRIVHIEMAGSGRNLYVLAADWLLLIDLWIKENLLTQKNEFLKKILYFLYRYRFYRF